MKSLERDLKEYARDIDQLSERIYNLRFDTSSSSKKRKLIKIADALSKLSYQLDGLA